MTGRDPGAATAGPLSTAFADFFSRQRQLDGGLRAELLGLSSWVAPLAVIDAPNGFGEETWVDALSESALSIRLEGAHVTSRNPASENAMTAEGSASAFLKAGQPSRFVATGPVRFAQIFFPESLVTRATDSLHHDGRVDRSMRDQLIFSRCGNLDTLARGYVDASARHATALEMEARALLLLECLLTHGEGPRRIRRGGLAPWQLRRACEAMEARLDGEIGLEMLADIVGCSPTHFSRAFKQSLGVPPFVWLVGRRIERAKVLLADRGVQLADVALAVGFSAQPQFTTAFKRVTGVTPGVWRRDRISAAWNNRRSVEA